MTLDRLIFLLPLLGVFGLLYIFWKSAWISRQDAGTERMHRIAKHIADGAMAFLRAEYRIMAVFVVSVAVLLFFNAAVEGTGIFIVLSFITGAVLSALAGYIGMRVATKANVRTTNAARTSLNKALEVAFSGGSVMGIGVVTLGILGLSILFILMSQIFGTSWGANPRENVSIILNVISSFSLGASSIALFARVGGGIYTKAADVGADLVGKVEAGIPEDHPLNPATIADNVGDNVGDVAGMGADLFESFVGAIIAAMVLGAAFVGLPGFSAGFELGPVLLPLALSALGILTSLLGTFFVKIKDNGNPKVALDRGELISGLILFVASFFLIRWFLPETWVDGGRTYTSLGVFFATVIGLAIGLAIGKITEYYTATGKKPVQGIVDQSMTGSATNIIAGLELGMKSTAVPIIGLSAAIVGSYSLAGLYGVAIAAVAMLANTGMQLAIDAYGPIADNAGGIAEMAELPKEVRKRTDKLDAVGNTTAAIGKGFAIASATLTALALFSAYMIQAGISSIDVSKPSIMAGLLIGGMLPYLFSSMALGAVGRAARSMIAEVRRQFREIPSLTNALAIMRKYDGDIQKATEAERAILEEADKDVEYEKCVAISTQASLREMILPGLLAIIAPAVVGYLGGAEMLGGLLAGVMASGVLLAIYQSNAGGAWDNAKKMVEEGIVHEDVHHGKGSDSHKATVVGDTVGDPFKDTSGPSLNILLKLMSVVALVIAPSIAINSLDLISEKPSAPKVEEIRLEKIQTSDSTFIYILNGDTVKDAAGMEEVMRIESGNHDNGDQTSETRIEKRIIRKTLE